MEMLAAESTGLEAEGWQIELAPLAGRWGTLLGQRGIQAWSHRMPAHAPAY